MWYKLIPTIKTKTTFMYVIISENEGEAMYIVEIQDRQGNGRKTRYVVKHKTVDI